jgi:hypothetical protein
LLFSFEQSRRNDDGDFLARLSNLPFASRSYDLMATTIVNNDGIHNPPVANPTITADMLKYLRMWNYPPVKTASNSSATITAQECDVTHYVGYIGLAPFFGGDFTTFEDAEIAFTGSFTELIGRPPDEFEMWILPAFCVTSHEATASVTTYEKTGKAIVLLNISKIHAVLGAGNHTFQFNVQTGSSKGHGDFLRWSCDAWLFKNRKTFEVDADNKLDDFSKLVSHVGFHASTLDNDGAAIPGHTMEFTVNCKTLVVTGFDG